MSAVLVTGATGTVGSAVTRELAARGVDVRAFVRDAGRAATMLGPDVELVAGDFGEPASLTEAMKGVDRLFLACPNHPLQAAYECSVIDAAAEAGVDRVVKLSAYGAEAGSPLAVWDAHGRIERHLAASGAAAVVLRPAMYMTGVLAGAETVKAMGMLFVPAGDARVAMIDPADVAAAAAVALAADRFEPATWTLTGPEALTYGEVAGRLAALLGRTVTYVDVPDDQALGGMLQAGLPEWLASNLVTLFGLVRQGVMAETTGTFQEVTGRAPRTFAAFAGDVLPAFR